MALLKDLRQYRLRRNLDREARLSKRSYKVRLYLVLHGRNHGSGSKRSCVGEPVQQELQAEEMVTVRVGYVNGCEIFAALGDPIYQFLRMLHGQKRVDEGGVAVAIRSVTVLATQARSSLPGGRP
jgi:hypothetical protein